MVLAVLHTFDNPLRPVQPNDIFIRQWKGGQIPKGCSVHRREEGLSLGFCQPEHSGVDDSSRSVPRLISKEHAKVVADAGGVGGVWTKLADSLKEFVESVSDTDLLSSRVGQGTNKAWPGLTGGFFSAVVGETLLQGFKADDIGKDGGGNFCRVFDKVTAGHA
jgi:hypothetical protein